MCNMRSEFEMLPEIEEILKGGEILLNEKDGLYYSIRQDDGGVEEALNLSFSIFKNQKESIFSLLSAIDWHIEDCNISEETEYTKAWLEAMVYVKKELLK